MFRMRSVLSLLLASLLVTFVGCTGGDDASADEGLSQAEIQKKAQGMDKSQLEAVIASYRTAIASIDKDIAAVTKKIGAVAPADLLSDATKELKTESSDLAKNLDAVKSRLNVYTSELAKR